MAVYPRTGARSTRPAALPRARARGARVLGRGRHLPRLRRAAPGGQRVRLLRRTAVRQRPAALRPPDHRLRQGRGAALPHHAGRTGSSAGSAGTPTGCPPRWRPNDCWASPARPTSSRWASRSSTRPAASRCCATPGVAGLRHPPGPLGRLRARLQDPRPPLHGERHVGVPAAVGQGPGLPGLQGAAVLLAVRDAAVQPRAADGRRHLRRAAGPVGHGAVQAGDRRVAAGLDDHAVDAAVQPGRRGRRRTSATSS